jgi:hypothetical protein
MPKPVAPTPPDAAPSDPIDRIEADRVPETDDDPWSQTAPEPPAEPVAPDPVAPPDGISLPAQPLLLLLHLR